MPESNPEEEEGWGDQEYGDDAWNEAAYGDEDDEIVQEAMQFAKKENTLKNLLEEVRIEFKPPVSRPGQIAQVAGDFTDWVP